MAVVSNLDILFCYRGGSLWISINTHPKDYFTEYSDHIICDFFVFWGVCDWESYHRKYWINKNIIRLICATRIVVNIFSLEICGKDSRKSHCGENPIETFHDDLFYARFSLANFSAFFNFREGNVGDAALTCYFVCSLFVAIFWDNIIWKVKANKTTH